MDRQTCLNNKRTDRLMNKHTNGPTDLCLNKHINGQTDLNKQTNGHRLMFE
jgi:hypothetical protein